MVSMEEFMTIGAFARRTGLSVSAIRFYASQQLLVPAEVDSTSGYRRYSEAQVSDGMLIRDLRRLEMPLSDIALALERTEPERKELVERHLRRLEEVVMRAHNLAQAMGVASQIGETTMSATLHTVDLAGALEAYTRAIDLDPSNYIAYCSRGVVRAARAAVRAPLRPQPGPHSHRSGERNR